MCISACGKLRNFSQSCSLNICLTTQELNDLQQTVAIMCSQMPVYVVHAETDGLPSTQDLSASFLVHFPKFL